MKRWSVLIVGMITIFNKIFSLLKIENNMGVIFEGISLRCKGY